MKTPPLTVKGFFMTSDGPVSIEEATSLKKKEIASKVSMRLVEHMMRKEFGGAEIKLIPDTDAHNAGRV